MMQLISVDDHVVEPPDLWVSRAPAKLRERVPRVVRGPGVQAISNGKGGFAYLEDPSRAATDWWWFEDVRMPITRNFVAAGHFTGEVVDLTEGTTYDEMRPGCIDPQARLADMDVNGVLASVCFPNTIPRFCGQTFYECDDRELGMVCVRAYNDWLMDEWCAAAPDRLVPVILIPLWDPEAAADEIYERAGQGARCISFSELPAKLGLPSIHDTNGFWDPVFRACDETSTVICLHCGSSSTMPHTAPDAPKVVSSSLVMVNSMMTLADWLFSGVLEQYHNFKIMLSESEIGWIPTLLERADRKWHMNRSYFDIERVPRVPSEYYLERVYSSFISDEHGVESIDKIGVDNVCFEVDFPHQDSTWPESQKVAEEQLRSLSPADREKIMFRNAAKLFSIPL